MRQTSRPRLPAFLGWSGVTAIMVVPVVIAAFSPYLPSRSVPYIVGGFAGIVCLSLQFLQPLLPAGYLAGSEGLAGRRWHRWLGVAIVAAVALHVGGLYVTSPADTMDALLLVSPTPFSVYGVTAMWGIVATAVLVLLRRRVSLRFAIWRLVHNVIGAIVVVAVIVHALQIEGAMEPTSKWMLCIAVAVSTSVALFDLRVVKPLIRWRARSQRGTAVDALAEPEGGDTKAGLAGG
jgi:predicted ferric reductase